MDRPNFGICLDTWNVWQNPDVEKAISACGNRIFVVQVSDWETLVLMAIATLSVRVRSRTGIAGVLVSENQQCPTNSLAANDVVPDLSSPFDSGVLLSDHEHRHEEADSWVQAGAHRLV